MDIEAAICNGENSNKRKMKRNSNLMVYLKFLEFNDNFIYAFDSLSGTELKVSLNAILNV